MWDLVERGFCRLLVTTYAVLSSGSTDNVYPLSSLRAKCVQQLNSDEPERYQTFELSAVTVTLPVLHLACANPFELVTASRRDHLSEYAVRAIVSLQHLRYLLHAQILRLFSDATRTPCGTLERINHAQAISVSSEVCADAAGLNFPTRARTRTRPIVPFP